MPRDLVEAPVQHRPYLLLEHLGPAGGYQLGVMGSQVLIARRDPRHSRIGDLPNYVRSAYIPEEELAAVAFLIAPSGSKRTERPWLE